MANLKTSAVAVALLDWWRFEFKMILGLRSMVTCRDLARPALSWDVDCAHWVL